MREAPQIRRKENFMKNERMKRGELKLFFTLLSVECEYSSICM